MYPYPWHPHHFYRRRMGLFPRLFWFGFGAFAATWWAKHHQHEGPLCNRRQQYIKDREEQPEQSRRAPLPSYTPASYPPVRTESDSWSVDKLDREKIRELGTQATDAVSGYPSSTQSPPY
jgi:hypothetical protein